MTGQRRPGSPPEAPLPRCRVPRVDLPVAISVATHRDLIEIQVLATVDLAIAIDVPARQKIAHRLPAPDILQGLVLRAAEESR